MAVAAEESAKSKAAKDVIKSLTAQVSLPTDHWFLVNESWNFLFDLLCTIIMVHATICIHPIKSICI